VRGFFFGEALAGECPAATFFNSGNSALTSSNKEKFMKIWLIAALCTLALAGCSSEYIITTTDGQMLTSDGKPHLDKDTGMIEFTDSQGRKQQIPQSDVKQMLER
jgi:hypothetical protein